VTKQRFLRIARILSTTGGLVGDKMIEPVKKEDVAATMVELLPWGARWIEHCLPAEYKKEKHKPQDEKGTPSTLSPEAEEKLTEREKQYLSVFDEPPPVLGGEGKQEATVIERGITNALNLEACETCGRELWKEGSLKRDFDDKYAELMSSGDKELIDKTNNVLTTALNQIILLAKEYEETKQHALS
jgi:hypothetical protein